MPGKRQHYIPRFLLRRFGIDPSDAKTRVWRLDKKRGAPLRVNPHNEAVIGRYYRIVGEDGSVDDTADELLDRFEARAARVIGQMDSEAYFPSAEDAFWLVNFIVTLKARTPRAREGLREADQRLAELRLEVIYSDAERYYRRMARGRDRAEVEAERVRVLDEIRSGRVTMHSPPSREIAMMFAGFEDAATRVFEELGYLCLRVPEDCKSTFVLSDHPVSHYDPTPKTPEAGASFMSSESSMTFLPIGPRLGLLLVQGAPQTWSNKTVSQGDVDELNLLTYAWADRAIYGMSQEAVVRVRRSARASPSKLARFRYRPPRIWTTEITDTSDRSAHAGPRRFTSTLKGRTTSRALHVSQEAIDEARRAAWWPDDDAAQ